ncbi:hypothetical protein ACIBCU_16775 [Streptomyces sp. NPDC051064]|uniref:hypothetical protein n=1 Tax=Streptomyces sp. NPDC051064 TaxID=3365641 RepID=UPI0037957A19
MSSSDSTRRTSSSSAMAPVSSSAMGLTPYRRVDRPKATWRSSTGMPVLSQRTA